MSSFISSFLTLSVFALSRVQANDDDGIRVEIIKPSDSPITVKLGDDIILGPCEVVLYPRDKIEPRFINYIDKDQFNYETGVLFSTEMKLSGIAPEYNQNFINLTVQHHDMIPDGWFKGSVGAKLGEKRIITIPAGPDSIDDSILDMLNVPKKAGGHGLKITQEVVKINEHRIPDFDKRFPWFEMQF